MASCLGIALFAVVYSALTYSLGLASGFPF